MGICESKTNQVIPPKNQIIQPKIQVIQPKLSESIKLTKSLKRNSSLQLSRINNELKRSNLSKVQSLKLYEKLDKDISTILSESICKIIIGSQMKKIIGTGFLVNFELDQEFFYCLITNSTIITNEIINNKNQIYLSYFNGNKPTNIHLDQNKRYIKTFNDINLDVTVVEILDGDNISKDNFLFPEPEIAINNNLINSSIYIPHHLNENELKNVGGIIKEIDKNKFRYISNAIKSSPGSPIFLENCVNVLGIHESQKENSANFIYPVINILKNDIRNKRNIGNYMNGKYVWEDGKYYMGQFQNNLPNGKGIKYYPNGNILYEGDFINGKFEGNGKYNYDNGNYFIGKYKNGLRIGKGIIYYNNGSVMFEGEYVNGEKEGNGKYIWEDGQYYLGQWKNSLRHGKGILYYSNGNIKYEGEFFNDKLEGNGKYIWRDGEYFLGQYKTGLRSGKGIMYYHNGKIKYEGDFVNDNFEGNGKYIWEDGEYYEGQFKNDLSEGKGTIYYSNGKIKYQGDWINDEFVGKQYYY